MTERRVCTKSRCTGFFHALISALLCVTAVLTLGGCGSSARPVQEMVAAEAAAEASSSLAPLPVDARLQAFTLVGGFPEYMIGPNDLIEITLRDVEVKSETVTVRPDGNISFSLVENVAAAGLTPTQLDDTLTERLREFLRDPKIDVEVTEYRSKYFSLLGSVQVNSRFEGRSGQGRYPLKTRMTVLDAILEGGGSTADAQLEKVQLIRDGHSYELNLQRVLNTGDKTNNVVLQGEDIIIVPGTNLRSQKVVVLGEVSNQGVYMFADGSRLMEALSTAGGLTASALRDDIRVIRVVEGRPQMFRVNFERLTSRADVSQNVVIKNDDIVYVPRSFMGDVNEVIAKIEPLLNILLLPATYRDLYTTGGGLRLDTGQPETGQTFTRVLPGTAGKATGTGSSGDSDDAERQDTDTKGD